MSQEFQLYRFMNLDGSTKDWAIRNNHDGTYTKRWGKTGTRLQSKEFLLKHPQALTNDINKKERKGYQFIGNRDIDDEGNLGLSPSAKKAIDLNVHPEDQLYLFWRLRIRQQSTPDTQTIEQFQDKLLSIGKILTDVFGASAFLKDMIIVIKELASNAGQIAKEQGVSSLLLFMAVMKIAPPHVSIQLSHGDGVEISNKLKLESKALSFFDTDLETVRPVAEALGLLEKRLDLSTITSQEDFYF